MVDRVEKSDDRKRVRHRERNDLRHDSPGIRLYEPQVVLLTPDGQSGPARDRIQSREQPVEAFRLSCHEAKLLNRVTWQRRRIASTKS